jgi:hypothetical protein
MKTDIQEVQVCTMNPYFLYLPVSYAISNRCFGRLEEGYNLVEKQAWPPVMKSDAGVLEILNSDDPEYSNVWFALCDPVELLKPENNLNFRGIRILAPVVCSWAFWAVNHKSKMCEFLSELAHFDNIIAYKTGTTSNRIAKTILSYKQNADPANFIIEVDSGNERRSFTNSKEGTIMISPEIDAIELLLNKHPKYKIVSKIGKMPEYSNTLTTVLLAREDIVCKHPKLVHSFLVGIQMALNAIHERDQALLEYARHSARDGESAASALDAATESNVIPMTIRVNSDSWFRAAEKYFQYSTPDLKSDQLEEKKRFASEVFKACAEPIDSIREIAIRESQEAARFALKPDERKRKWIAAGYIFFGSLLGVGLAALCFYGHGKEAAIAITTIASGWLLQQFVTIKLLSFHGICHWVAIVILGFSLMSMNGGYFDRGINIGLLIAGLTFWLAIFSPRYEKSGKA